MQEIFTINESDLASRRSAARLRDQLEELLACGGPVRLDLHHVLSVSESYADELFGVFVAENGFDWLVSHVHVIHAKPEVARTIALAIKRRLDGGMKVSSTLLVARDALERKREKACC